MFDHKVNTMPTNVTTDKKENHSIRPLWNIIAAINVSCLCSNVIIKITYNMKHIVNYGKFVQKNI